MKDLKITITIDYKYGGVTGQNKFTTLQELKVWCDMHPDLAKALGYTKGK